MVADHHVLLVLPYTEQSVSTIKTAIIAAKER